MDSTNSDCRRPTARLVESVPEPAAVERDEPDPLVAAELGTFGGHCAQTDLWGAIRDLFEGPDRVSRVRSVLDPLGADYVYLTERKVAETDDRRQDFVQLHHPIGDASGLSSKWDKLVEAYNGMNRNVTNHGCAPPGFITPGSALNRFVSARMPFRVRDLPTDERRFCELGVSCWNNCLDDPVRDMAVVPLSGGTPGKPIKFMVFTSHRLFKEAEAFRSATLAVLGIVGLEQAKLAGSCKIHPKLSDREIEIYSWAIKGKTVEEISMITGFSVQSSRYSLYRVRDLLGYATVAQAMVHVAKAYDIHP